jgi:hypothetical protein
MSKQVAMVHPDLEHTKEAPVLVSEESFEQVWKARGWKLAPKKVQPETEENE